MVTRQGGKASVVIMSAEGFDAWQETVHLLSSPVNAARLLRSIRSADAAEVVEHELVPAGSSAVA